MRTPQSAALLAITMISLVIAAPVALAQHHHHHGQSQAATPATPPAPTAEQIQAARAAYAHGQELFRAGSYADAEQQFVTAFAAVPNPVVLLSVAECQEREQHLTDAAASLQRYLELRADAPDRAAVEQRIAGMQARPATIIVSSSPSGGNIAIDGQATGRQTPAELQLPPGEHNVTVTLEGRDPESQTVTLALGAREQVTLTLPVSLAAASEDDVFGSSGSSASGDANAASGPDSGEQDQGGGQSGHHANAGMWVAASVGGAALVGGTIFGFLALSAQSDYNANPTQSALDRGKRDALIADIGFATALVGAGLAVILYLTSGGDDSQDVSSDASARRTAPSVAVAPMLGRDTAGLAAAVRF